MCNDDSNLWKMAAKGLSHVLQCEDHAKQRPCHWCEQSFDWYESACLNEYGILEEQALLVQDEQALQKAYKEADANGTL